MASGIIAKLPPTWKDFSTSLKHKRKEFCLAELMRTFDVEEKARAKDTHGKDVESSSAKHEIHKACQMATGDCQKIEKLRSYSIGLCPYV